MPERVFDRRSGVPLGPATVLLLFRVSFVCGGKAGQRLIFAPDRHTAARTVSEHASVFGLAHEGVEALIAVRVPVREPRVAV